MNPEDKPSRPRKARSAPTTEEVLGRLKELGTLGSAGEIAEAVCEAVADLLGAQACSVFLPNPCHDALTLAASRHIPREAWQQITVKAWDGLLGRVMAMGQPLALGSRADFHKLEAEVRPHYGPPACLIVPMLGATGVVAGVICAASPRGRSKFLEREQRLLESIAGFASGALTAIVHLQETNTMHDRMAEILDNLHVGVLALDFNLRVIHANHRFAEMIGRPFGELLGQKLKDMLDLQLFNFCNRMIREAPDEVSIVQERFEGKIGGKDGSCVVTISNLKTACGAGDFLMMIEDISHEEEIRRLRESDAIKRSFLRIISHELRTPITVLQGMLPLLEGEAAANPSSVAKAHTLLRANTQRLNHTVNLLLDAVDIDNGKLTLGLRPVDVNEMLLCQIRGLESRIAARKLTAQIELDGGLPMLNADNQRLRNMVTELLDNAIKFSAEGGVLRVRTARAEGGMADILISDQGEVIPAEKRDEVFGKFYQLDRETTRKSAGMGLGLYVSRNLALLHGGSLEIVEGETPGETVFRLRLPLAPS